MDTIDIINDLRNRILFAMSDTNESQRLDDAVSPKKSFSKWSCYSDYCFHDPHKPNEAVSFILLPFESEQVHQDYLKFIQTKQPKDLKAVKSVNSEFLSFLRSKGVITFGYILNDFAKWLDVNDEKQKENIKKCFLVYKRQFDLWKVTAINADMRNYYDSLSKQLDAICSKPIKNKEINTYTELLLVAVLGAVSISQVAKRLDKVEVLGWFSDRDAILDKGQGLICSILYATLYCIIQIPDFKFPTYNLDSTNKPFFDDFNRISDIVTGTLADYDVHNNLVSKDKFGKVLRELFADNESVFIHRLVFGTDVKVSEILIHSKP